MRSILPCHARRWLFMCLALAGLLAGRAVAQPISIVAAENFYGDVAQQLAGRQRDCQQCPEQA